MAEEFDLTPPTEPLQLCRPIAHQDAMNAAMREAVDAALKGDFDRMDLLEVNVLNLLVRIGELFVKDANGTPHWWFNPDDERFGSIDDERFAPFVVRTVRGYTAEGRTALHWALMERCRRCDGKLRHLPCKVCAGTWYVGTECDAHVELYTDVYGVILPGQDLEP